MTVDTAALARSDKHAVPEVRRWLAADQHDIAECRYLIDVTEVKRTTAHADVSFFAALTAAALASAAVTAALAFSGWFPTLLVIVFLVCFAGAAFVSCWGLWVSLLHSRSADRWSTVHLEVRARLLALEIAARTPWWKRYARRVIPGGAGLPDVRKVSAFMSSLRGESTALTPAGMVRR